VSLLGTGEGGELMALDSHIRELDARHRTLDMEISAEAKRPSTDTIRLTEMKRQRLKIKEEIAALKGR
ncbi:MAG TPA: DUF465 domain-containing protein, partial [Caulobacterales bacterium]|nr:DUF465 domain-containing protein [Caulobacterales bacterium]